MAAKGRVGSQWWDVREMVRKMRKAARGRRRFLRGRRKRAKRVRARSSAGWGHGW